MKPIEKKDNRMMYTWSEIQKHNKNKKRKIENAENGRRTNLISFI
jgi:hypothetical protein